MFDDTTYLKLYVSPSVNWDDIIKKTYGRRDVNKAELKNRIAFTVVQGQRGVVQQYKETMFLEYADSITQYKSEDWCALFDEIKLLDKDIAETRAQLKKIEYLTPELVPHDSMTYWAYNFLINEWELTEEQAAEEVSLYGSRTIEKFSEATGGKYYRNRGRYHFVRALHAWAISTSRQLIACKKDELKTTMFE